MKLSNVKPIFFAAALFPLSIATNVFSGTVTPPPPQFVPPPVGSVGPVFVPPIAVTAPDLNEEVTQAIEKQLLAAHNLCRRLPAEEYTIDCLGDALAQIARQMPATGEYAEARAIIDQTARKLRDLARKNASNDLPRGYLRSPGAEKKKLSSALTPVRTDTLQQTNKAATAILEEAETRLLRSAENSAARKVHYQRIAVAVGSNKVLLRSL